MKLRTPAALAWNQVSSPRRTASDFSAMFCSRSLHWSRVMASDGGRPSVASFFASRRVSPLLKPSSPSARAPRSPNCDGETFRASGRIFSANPISAAQRSDFFSMFNLFRVRITPVNRSALRVNHVGTLPSGCYQEVLRLVSLRRIHVPPQRRHNCRGYSSRAFWPPLAAYPASADRSACPPIAQLFR